LCGSVTIIATALVDTGSRRYPSPTRACDAYGIASASSKTADFFNALPHIGKMC